MVLACAPQVCEQFSWAPLGPWQAWNRMLPKLQKDGRVSLENGGPFRSLSFWLCWHVRSSGRRNYTPWQLTQSESPSRARNSTQIVQKRRKHAKIGTNSSQFLAHPCQHQVTQVYFHVNFRTSQNLMVGDIWENVAYIEYTWHEAIERFDMARALHREFPFESGGGWQQGTLETLKCEGRKHICFKTDFISFNRERPAKSAQIPQKTRWAREPKSKTAHSTPFFKNLVVWAAMLCTKST